MVAEGDILLPPDGDREWLLGALAELVRAFDRRLARESQDAYDV